MKRQGMFLCSMLAVLLVVFLGCLPCEAGSSPKPKKQAAPSFSPLAGARFGPGMPRGYEEVGGGVMSDGNHRMTDHAIQIVRKGEVEMAWLSRVAGTDAAGQPVYEIRDVLRLPRRSRGETLTWFACCYGGKRNDAIIAYTDKYFYRVFKAWVASRETGRIEEVSTRGIVCQDPATILK